MSESSEILIYVSNAKPEGSTVNTETRKARSTKTTVERTDREIVCVDHGGVLELDSIKQAREFMSCPQDWCMDCQDNFYLVSAN